MIRIILFILFVFLTPFLTRAQTSSSIGLSDFTVTKGTTTLHGLKDSTGKIVLPANYFDIRGLMIGGS